MTTEWTQVTSDWTQMTTEWTQMTSDWTQMTTEWTQMTNQEMLRSKRPRSSYSRTTPVRTLAVISSRDVNQVSQLTDD